MNKKERIEGTIINSNGLCINNNNTFLEKTADEMFEELRYEKYDNHPEDDLPPKPNMFSTQDARRLYYEQRGILKNGLKAIEHIEFELQDRNVVCWAKVDEKLTVVPLGMQELQAINEKVRELRLDIMKINNLKESIEYFKKINDYRNGGN